MSKIKLLLDVVQDVRALADTKTLLRETASNTNAL